MTESAADGQNGSLVRRLFNDLRDGLNLNVHSVQLLSCSDDDWHKWQWRVASVGHKTFKNMVLNYTGVSTTEGQPHRSLAYLEVPNDAWPCWRAEWARDPAYTESADDAPAELTVKEETWNDREFPVVQDSDLLINRWKEEHSQCFRMGGVAFWATLKHPENELHSSAPENVEISHVFVVLQGPHDIGDETHTEISRKLNQLLSDHVTLHFQRAIRNRFTKLARDLNVFLKSGDREEIIADSTKREIHKYQTAIAGRFPLLIEGVRGTGKHTVAKIIFEGFRRNPLAETIDIENRRNFETEDDALSLKVVDCFALPKEAREAIKDPLISDWWIESPDGHKINPAFNQGLLLDDIHGASAEVQQILYKAIEAQIEMARAYNSDALPLVLATIEPGGARAVAEGKLIPSLYSSLSACSITLPTLHERLGECATLDDANTDLEKIVRKMIRDGEGLLTDGLPDDTIDKLIKIVRSRTWPGNYTELRQFIFHELIEHASAASVGKLLMEQDDALVKESRS